MSLTDATLSGVFVRTDQVQRFELLLGRGPERQNASELFTEMEHEGVARVRVPVARDRAVDIGCKIPHRRVAGRRLVWLDRPQRAYELSGLLFRLAGRHPPADVGRLHWRLRRRRVEFDDEILAHGLLLVLDASVRCPPRKIRARRGRASRLVMKGACAVRLGNGNFAETGQSGARGAFGGGKGVAVTWRA